MKRRVAGFLLAVAATGSGCMTNDGFSHQHMGMQNGAMRLASSEHGPVPVHGYNPAMMSGGFMPGVSKNTPSPIMQVGYAGGEGGILQAGGCAGGACALPGAPPMGGFGGGFDGIGGDPGCYTTGGRVHSFGHLPGGAEANLSTQRTQVKFVGPINAKVGWYVQGPDGRPVLSTGQITMPGRYNFAQAAIYSLKISDIQGRPGVELYPTIEVVPTNAKTDAFLSHNAVPVEFTDEDLGQVREGNFITKVIYLPDAQYQSLAGGIEELSSTRLEPGVDPIAEAMRRGHILLVIRVGNISRELPNSPPLNAPGMGAPAPMMPAPGGIPMPGALPAPSGMPGPIAPAGFQMPPGGMASTPVPPGAKAPKAAFPLTSIPAPRGLGFDAEEGLQPAFRVREGAFDKAIWGR